MTGNGQFRCIGKGHCGSVWAADGNEEAMKREDGGPERSLQNDWHMHKIISNRYKSNPGLSITIPEPIAFIPASDVSWW